MDDERVDRWWEDEEEEERMDEMGVGEGRIEQADR